MAKHFTGHVYDTKQEEPHFKNGSTIKLMGSASRGGIPGYRVFEQFKGSDENAIHDFIPTDVLDSAVGYARLRLPKDTSGTEYDRHDSAKVLMIPPNPRLPTSQPMMMIPQGDPHSKGYESEPEYTQPAPAPATQATTIPTDKVQKNGDDMKKLEKFIEIKYFLVNNIV